ncbi:MAG: hypothetical protein K6U74_10765 [Firmicutes bacterium]|nr:hypothetical protein [Bacillota bacterium]
MILNKKICVVALLAGAALSAFKVGKFTAWAGIVCYVVCIAAIAKNRREASVAVLLLAAAHAFLTAYSFWNLYANSIPLCPYCLITAGLVWLAAALMWKPLSALVPAAAMVAVWYAWPWLMPAEYRYEHPRTVYYEVGQPPESHPSPAGQQEPLRVVKPG